MIRRMIRRLRPCLSPELIKGRGHSVVDFIFKECENVIFPEFCEFVQYSSKYSSTVFRSNFNWLFHWVTRDLKIEKKCF